MRLCDLKPAARLERVAFALDVVLQDLAEPTDTAHVLEGVCRRLGGEDPRLVGRTLMQIAPQIPEARRSGEAFVKFGRMFERWEWWPKGQTPGGPTRQAKRDLAWRGRLYATPAELEIAQQAEGVWEVENGKP